MKQLNMSQNGITRTRRSYSKVMPNPTPPQQPKPTGPPSKHSSSEKPHHPRTRSIFKDSHQQAPKKVTNSEANIERILTTPIPERPSSSLSKFRVLPEINSNRDLTDIDIMTQDAQRMILDSTSKPSAHFSKKPNFNNVRKSSDKRKLTQFSFGNTKGYVSSSNVTSPLHKKTKPNFPSKGTKSTSKHETKQLSASNEQSEHQVLLALKLPDGKRIERYFDRTTTIHELMNYVQSQITEKIEECDVYSMQTVPKTILTNWNQSLKHFDIKDRTVLYIEERD